MLVQTGEPEVKPLVDVHLFGGKVQCSSPGTIFQVDGVGLKERGRAFRKHAFQGVYRAGAIPQLAPTILEPRPELAGIGLDEAAE